MSLRSADARLRLDAIRRRPSYNNYSYKPYEYTQPVPRKTLKEKLLVIGGGILLGLVIAVVFLNIDVVQLMGFDDVVDKNLKDNRQKLRDLLLKSVTSISSFSNDAVAASQQANLQLAQISRSVDDLTKAYNNVTSVSQKTIADNEKQLIKDATDLDALAQEYVTMGVFGPKNPNLRDTVATFVDVYAKNEDKSEQIRSREARAIGHVLGEHENGYPTAAVYEMNKVAKERTDQRMAAIEELFSMSNSDEAFTDEMRTKLRTSIYANESALARLEFPHPREYNKDPQVEDPQVEDPMEE